MGTVDFWVPVNRHRREPGGPHESHDTIISRFLLASRNPRINPRNRRDTCVSRAGAKMVRAPFRSLLRNSHTSILADRVRDLISASLVRTH